MNLVLLAGERTFGYNVRVSRDLLVYAQEHKEKLFVTDICTFNEMYVANGFKAPANVVTVKQLGPTTLEASQALSAPPPKSVVPDANTLIYEDFRGMFGEDVPQCDKARVDGILVNLHRAWIHSPEAAFSSFLKAHGGERTTISGARYRLLCVPLIPLLGPRGYMIKTPGGELCAVRRTSE